MPRDNAPAGVEVSFATPGRRGRPRRAAGRGVDADPELIRMDYVPPMFTLRDPDGNRLGMVERD